jgi:hypothetical protein
MRSPFEDLTDARALRRRFFGRLWSGLRIVRPIVSFLLGLMLALGAVIGVCEGWSISETVYFTFVSGLTIGFGDLVPTTLLTRVLTIMIGICGVLQTALLAALAVKALTGVMDDREK